MAVVGGRGIESEFKRNESEIAYHNFVESFKSEATKKMYVESFNSFLEFLQLMKGGEEKHYLKDPTCPFLSHKLPLDVNEVDYVIAKIHKYGNIDDYAEKLIREDIERRRRNRIHSIITSRVIQICN